MRPFHPCHSDNPASMANSCQILTRASTTALILGCLLAASSPSQLSGTEVPNVEVIAVAANGITPFEVRVPRLPEGPVFTTPPPIDDPVKATAAIQKAITACHEAGGGIVKLSAGIHITGGLRLLDGVFLHIPENAVLEAWRPGRGGMARTEPDREMTATLFPEVESRWEGNTATMPMPLIWAENAKRIGLFGEGELFGNDRAIVFKECSGVRVQGLVIRNAWRWSVVALYSTDVLFDNLTLLTRGRNSDGINPDSSRRVVIRNCYFETGDDCIAIKSGRDGEGRRINRPSQDLLIEDCQMISGHGFAIGSEMAGGVSNVLIRRINTAVPLRIKTGSQRGGYIRQVRYQDIFVRLPEDRSRFPLRDGGELTYGGRDVSSPHLPIIEDLDYHLIGLRRDEAGRIVEAMSITAGFHVPRGTLDAVFTDLTFTPLDLAKVPTPPTAGLMTRIQSAGPEDRALLERIVTRYAHFRISSAARERLTDL
jgi:hypothetical protein